MAPNPFAGWLVRVRTPTTSPADRERRVFAVVVGGTLFEYSSEEEAGLDAAAPRAMCELIGVSGSAAGAPALSARCPEDLRFSAVTRLGTALHACAADEAAKECWVQAISSANMGSAITT